MLIFKRENGKLKKLKKSAAMRPWLSGKRKIYRFDLLAGWTCPFAHDCLSKVHEVDGKLKVVDGKHTKFRCYAASLEAFYPKSYLVHKHNTDTLKAAKTRSEMVSLIGDAFPGDAGIIRLHTAGDFFNQIYFDAWLEIVNRHPNVLFYAYTKNNRVWAKRLTAIPANFILTGSVGGKLDALLFEHNLRRVQVVFSRVEAKKLKLEIDEDDSHAANPLKQHQNFALLLHGVQPAGTPAAKAWEKLRRK